MHELKQLVGYAPLQRLLQQQWRGSFIDLLITSEAHPPWGGVVRLSNIGRAVLLLFALLVVLPLNLLLLPLAAALPPLANAVAAALPRVCCGYSRPAAARAGYSESLGCYWRRYRFSVTHRYSESPRLLLAQACDAT